jgi:nascent polypeptide-associated complex subunit alpha
MIPGMNPRKMQQMMKQLGVKQEEIEASEVVIKCEDKDLVIRNPSVQKVNMMGQETLQITGDIEEVSKENFKEEDVKMVSEQTGKGEDEARNALEKNDGDLAKAILDLK